MLPDPSASEIIALARTGLLEITEEATIGALVGHVVEEEGVVSLQFASLLPGYPGWLWTATIAQTSAEEAATVVEVEMLPGEGALIAPDWVPWTERLAEWRAHQEQLAAEAAARGETLEVGESDDDADDDDADDDDADDLVDGDDLGDDDDSDDDDEDDADEHEDDDLDEDGSDEELDDEDDESEDDDSEDDDSDDDDSDDDDSDDDDSDDEDEDSDDDEDDDRR